MTDTANDTEQECRLQAGIAAEMGAMGDAGVLERAADALAALRAENASLRRHLDRRASATDPVTAALRSENERLAEEARLAKADALAVRTLMNCYNLGGWTDAEAPMRRALDAEAALATARQDTERLDWVDRLSTWYFEWPGDGHWADHEESISFRATIDAARESQP